MRGLATQRRGQHAGRGQRHGLGKLRRSHIVQQDHIGPANGQNFGQLIKASAVAPVAIERHGKVQALAVVANRASEHICPDLTLVQQARFIGTGAGFLGTSRDYIEKIAAQLAVMGIRDQALLQLLTEVRAVAEAVAGLPDQPAGPGGGAPLDPLDAKPA